MSLVSYAIRRLLAGIVVVIVATLGVFLFMRLAPGDLALLMLAGPGGQGATSLDPQVLAEIRHQLGLDKPLLLQYLDFLGGLVTGDWGESFWTRRPLADELAARLPITIEIALLSELTAWIIALPLGILAAVRRGGWLDSLVRVVTTIGLSIPIFWLGTLILLALVIGFDWMPPVGIRPFREQPLAHLQQVALPVITLGAALATSQIRLIRAEVLETLGEPYVQTARAKGLHERTVLVHHVLRNALLAPLTYSGVRLGVLLGGIVLVETVFNIPGLGRLLVDAVVRRDYPVVQLVVALQAALFVLINLIVDLAYVIVDPRVRAQIR